MVSMDDRCVSVLVLEELVNKVQSKRSVARYRLTTQQNLMCG